MSTKIARRTQQRTEVTRGKLLDAATRIFSEQGFDGVSIRDLEVAADVQRGLLAYHFDDKDGLWKATADRIFGLLRSEVSDRVDVLLDLPERERVAATIRFYVRFCARHPELGRLLTQEGRQDSWRIRYLIDQHTRGIIEMLGASVKQSLGLDDRMFTHWFYMLVGASSTIFSHAPECRVLFELDPLEELMVETHADLMVKMLTGAFEP